MNTPRLAMTGVALPIVAWAVAALGADLPSPASASSASRIDEWVDVVHHGAKCDGMADDSAAFRAALDEARTRKVGVHVPPGTCIVLNVELYAGSVLRGAGRGRTTLKLKPGVKPADFLVDATGHASDGVTVLYTSYPSSDARPGHVHSSAPYNGGKPLADVSVQDLTVDGNHAAQNLAYKAWGIYLNGVTGAHIDGVTVQNCLTHGITLKEATRSIVRNVEVVGNGKGGGGDGLVLLSRCSDNVVTDSVARENRSIGFEDEGRFGKYNPVNRNARNRWVNLVSRDNKDHNFLLLFTDGSAIENGTSVGGATNGVNIVGTSKVRVVARIESPTRNGVWVRPEVYGADGTNRSLELDVTVTDAGESGLRIEDLQGGRIVARVRGVKGPYAMSIAPDRARPVADLDVSLDYDGTAGAKAEYGLYAYNPTRLALHDSNVSHAHSHNVWIDGTPAGVAGLVIQSLRSTGAGARSLQVTSGVLAPHSGRIRDSVLTGSAMSSAEVVTRFAEHADNAAP